MAKESGIVRIGNASLEILYDLALDRLIQPGTIALSPFIKLNRAGQDLSSLVQESAFFPHFSGVPRRSRCLPGHPDATEQLHEGRRLWSRLRAALPVRFVRQARRGFEWQP